MSHQRRAFGRGHGTGGVHLRPWVDPENFNPGYLARSLHLMPKQGDREPWQHLHEYVEEKDLLPAADLDDGTLVYR